MTWGNFDIKVEDHQIGGKLIRVSVLINDHEMMNVVNNEKAKEMMRSQLAYQLAEYMIQNKLIEVTKIPDPSHFGHRIVARCYLAPDSNIKILRRAV